MKHILVASLVLGSLIASSAIAQAPVQPDATPMQQRHMQRDPHRQAMHLSKRLRLNADQTARLEPILTQHHDQAKAIRQNTSLTPDQRKAQLHDLNRNTHQQMAGVLTPDQMQQWQAMRKQHHMREQQTAPAPTGV